MGIFTDSDGSDSPQLCTSSLPFLSRSKCLSNSADNIVDNPDSCNPSTTSDTTFNIRDSGNAEKLEHKQLLIFYKHLSCSTSNILSEKDTEPTTSQAPPSKRLAAPKRLSLPTPPSLNPLASYLTPCPENTDMSTVTAPPLLVHSLSSPALPLPHPDAYPPAASLALLERALVRRHRHSVSGQMSYFKMLGFGLSPGGGFIVQQKKPGCGSTSSLFSTAVISGSSSAPNLRDMIPSTPSISGRTLNLVFVTTLVQIDLFVHVMMFEFVVPAIDGCGGVPPIRPLETLHNALSLKQLDGFLDAMTSSLQQKTPIPSPPKVPSTPTPQSKIDAELVLIWCSNMITSSCFSLKIVDLCTF